MSRTALTITGLAISVMVMSFAGGLWLSSKPAQSRAPAEEQLSVAPAFVPSRPAPNVERPSNFRAPAVVSSAEQSGRAEEPHSPESRSPERRQELAELERQEHANLLVAHQQEPRDQAWARDTEVSFGSAFQAVASKFSFTFGRVDCRTESCVAKLTWPSFNVAQQDMHDLVPLLGDQILCGRRLTLPPPGPNGQVVAEMIIDCSEVRSGVGPPARD
jgi:hypothetical protein